LKEHTPFGTLPVLTVTSDTGATSYIISQSQSVGKLGINIERLKKKFFFNYRQ